MEQNLPVIAKRVWRIARVLFFMLRKSISKSKFMLDLNMMMKRGKIAGKALQNLILFHHHHHHHHSSTSNRRHSHNRHLSFNPQQLHEYEFSCSNTPNYSLFPFNHGTTPTSQLSKKGSSKHLQANYLYSPHSPFFSCAQSPAMGDDDVATMSHAVMAALEMLNSGAASPALPGFGRSPIVRQLRITDSPFPLRDDADEDSHVDEAAEQFIMKFYNDLKRQNRMSFSSG